MLSEPHWQHLMPSPVQTAALNNRMEIVRWAEDVSRMGMEIHPDDVTMFFLGFDLPTIRQIREERNRQALREQRVSLRDFMSMLMNF